MASECGCEVKLARREMGRHEANAALHMPLVREKCRLLSELLQAAHIQIKQMEYVIN
jgi:hypothetical protein